jgi:hypothetical protein
MTIKNRLKTIIGEGKMKVGSSLQLETIHHKMTATVPEMGKSHPPYLLAAFLNWLFFFDRFKLISIFLRKKTRRH